MIQPWEATTLLLKISTKNGIIVSLGSTHAKTYRQVLTDPVNGNIPWRKIEAMPEALGARIAIEGRGSRITVLLRGVRRDLHRPHPGKEALRYRVREVRDLLAETEIET